MPVYDVNEELENNPFGKQYPELNDYRKTFIEWFIKECDMNWLGHNIAFPIVCDELNKIAGCQSRYIRLLFEFYSTFKIQRGIGLLHDYPYCDYCNYRDILNTDTYMYEVLYQFAPK